MDLSKFVKKLSGKWVAVGGSRWINTKTAEKAGYVIKKLIDAKCKIVTGGAEGTDNAVMRSCLKYGIPENSLKVFLPCTIKEQYRHYCKLEGSKKSRLLLKTLLELKKCYPNAIKENQRRFKNYREAADFRNSLIIKQASGAVIFNPSRSKGSLDALRRIKKKRIPCLIFQ